VTSFSRKRRFLMQNWCLLHSAIVLAKRIQLRICYLFIHIDIVAVTIWECFKNNYTVDTILRFTWNSRATIFNCRLSPYLLMSLSFAKEISCVRYFVIEKTHVRYLRCNYSIAHWLHIVVAYRIATCLFIKQHLCRCSSRVLPLPLALFLTKSNFSRRKRLRANHSNYSVEKFLRRNVSWQIHTIGNIHTLLEIL